MHMHTTIWGELRQPGSQDTGEPSRGVQKAGQEKGGKGPGAPPGPGTRQAPRRSVRSPGVLTQPGGIPADQPWQPSRRATGMPPGLPRRE